MCLPHRPLELYLHHPPPLTLLPSPREAREQGHPHPALLPVRRLLLLFLLLRLLLPAAGRGAEHRDVSDEAQGRAQAGLFGAGRCWLLSQRRETVFGRCSRHGKGRHSLRGDEEGRHEAVGQIKGFGGYSALQGGKAGWCHASWGTWAPRRAHRVPAHLVLLRLVLLQQLLQFLQLCPADVGACAALAEGLQKGLEGQVLGQELLYLCLWDGQWD